MITKSWVLVQNCQQFLKTIETFQTLKVKKQTPHDRDDRSSRYSPQSPGKPPPLFQDGRAGYAHDSTLSNSWVG